MSHRPRTWLYVVLCAALVVAVLALGVLPGGDVTRAYRIDRSDPEASTPSRLSEEPPTNEDARRLVGTPTAGPSSPTGDAPAFAARPRRIACRVAGPEAMADARIHVALLDPGGHAREEADVAAGEVHAFGAVPWGAYTVRAEAPGLCAAALAAWTGVTELELAPLRSARGSVWLRRGVPLEGAQIHLVWPNGWRGWTWGPPAGAVPAAVTALEDGAASFELTVPAGVRSVVVWHPDWGGCWRSLPQEGPIPPLDVDLGVEADRVVAISVVDQEGAPIVPRIYWEVIAEAWVTLQPRRPRFTVAWPTDRGDPPDLFLGAREHATVRLPCPADLHRVQEVVLPRARGVLVRTVDREGRRVPGVDVYLGTSPLDATPFQHALTDVRGEAWLSREGGGRLIAWTSSPTLRPAVARVGTDAEEVAFVLEEDDPPVLVLDEALPREGRIRVCLRDPEGDRLWVRDQWIEGTRTPLRQLPSGRKELTLYLGDLDPPPTVSFEDEREIVVPAPGDFVGMADVVVRLEGRDHLDGLRVDVRDESREVAHASIEDSLLRLQLRREATYTLHLRRWSDVEPLELRVPAGPDPLEAVWSLPWMEVRRWSPRIVSDLDGTPVPGGTLALLAPPFYESALERDTVREGRVSVRVGATERYRAKVVSEGFAPGYLGPLAGSELLAIEEIRMVAPTRLPLRWEGPEGPRPRLYLVDLSEPVHGPSRQLEGRRLDARETSLELASGHAYLLWAETDDWIAPPQPVRLPASETVLQPVRTAALEVRLRASDVDEKTLRIWLSWPALGLGTSAFARWMRLPYGASAAWCKPYLARTDEGWTHAVGGLLPGPARLHVQFEEGVVVEREIDLPAGDTLTVEVAR